MDSEGSVVTVDEEEAGEEIRFKSLGTPVLRPTIRQLRHLEGVVLRNLVVRGRAQGSSKKVIPKPALVRRRLSIGAQNMYSDGDTGVVGRRRSTVSSMGAEIERALHDLNDNTLLDSFVVIHVRLQVPPVYISEVVQSTMNPEFREADFTQLNCRNATEIRVDVYAKPTGVERAWKRIVRENIDLTQMEFVGKSTDVIRENFGVNSVILQLSDGCYCVPHQKSSETTVAGSIPEHDDEKTVQNGNGNVDHDEKKLEPHYAAGVLTTASFDSIMKLNNFEECIADAEHTIELVSTQLNKLLGDADTSVFVQEKRQSQLQAQAKRTRQLARTELRKKAMLERQIAELRAKLDRRRQFMATQRSHRRESESRSYDAQRRLEDRSAKIGELESAIAREQARLAQDLEAIFPIEPLSTKSFAFTICGLYITSTKQPILADEEEEAGAAYGIVAQVVCLLADYLCVSLRYPVQPFGSTSFIVDPISTIHGSRTFPLWVKGSLFYRFEYGVYLLHKNVEQLANSQNVPIAELFQLLPNLKNLLLVVSSAKR